MSSSLPEIEFVNGEPQSRIRQTVGPIDKIRIARREYRRLESALTTLRIHCIDYSVAQAGCAKADIVDILADGLDKEGISYNQLVEFLLTQV